MRRSRPRRRRRLSWLLSSRGLAFVSAAELVTIKYIVILCVCVCVYVYVGSSYNTYSVEALQSRNLGSFHSDLYIYTCMMMMIVYKYVYIYISL